MRRFVFLQLVLEIFSINFAILIITVNLSSSPADLFPRYFGILGYREPYARHRQQQQKLSALSHFSFYFKLRPIFPEIVAGELANLSIIW